jgi:hypothetical protein
MRDRCDHPVRQDHAVHRRRQRIDDLLDRHQQRLRRHRRLALAADDAVQGDVAGAIGALRVQDGHVGIDRRHGRRGFRR